jgi:hypothetical protein
MPRCEHCGDELTTEHGLKCHLTTVHSDTVPWRDEELLRELYLDQYLSTVEIAEKWGCGPQVVRRALKKFDIPRRSNSKAQKLVANKKPAHFRTVPGAGYESWYHDHDNEQKIVQVHRLVAVAEYGFSSVAGKVVHHKNNIPWDNRPENLRLMTDSAHKSMHASKWKSLGRGANQ